jgi:hypothetical protein
MGCHDNSWPQINFAAVGKISEWDSAEPSDERVLVLSNNPETIAAADTTTARNLYKIEWLIPDSGVLNFRVMLWNGHAAAVTRNIIIRVGFRTFGGTVTAHKSISQIVRLGNLYQAGTCCAIAQVQGTLDPDDGPINIPVGQERDVKVYAVPGVGVEPFYACAVHEFAVLGNPGDFVRIRTLVSPNTTRGAYDDPVLNTVGTHPRGSWPYSSLFVEAGAPIDLSDPDISNVTFQVAALGGKDANLYVLGNHDPWGHPATGNKGLYGVNAQYHVMFTNSQPQISYLWRAYLVPANTGFKYWGALDPKIVRPMSTPGTDEDGNRVLIGEATTGPLLPNLHVKVATGGAAGTPVNIFCEWSVIN